MKHLSRQWAPWLALLLGAGCGTAANEGPPRGVPIDSGAAAPWFRSVGDVAVASDGTTLPITIELDAAPRSVLVKTTFADGQSHPESCFQLDSVLYRGAEVWVPPANDRIDWGPYCVTCKERVSIGHGYGLFSLPNDGSAPPSGGGLQLRPVLRECATNLPLDPRFGIPIPGPIHVEVAQFEPLASAARGQLRLSLVFAPGGQFSANTAMSNPLFADALATVRQQFALAAIDVAVIALRDLPGDGGATVTFSAVDHSQLDDVAGAARQGAPAPPSEIGAAVTLVFPRCIVQLDTLGGPPSALNGFASHIPGLSTSAVFVRGGACEPGKSAAYWPSGHLLGKVMAHEVAHHLGLYHSVEPDGRVDQLADTDGADLMNWSVLERSSIGLSPSQRAVLRMHPAVAAP